MEFNEGKQHEMVPLTKWGKAVVTATSELVGQPWGDGITSSQLVNRALHDRAFGKACSDRPPIHYALMRKEDEELMLSLNSKAYEVHEDWEVNRKGLLKVMDYPENYCLDWVIEGGKFEGMVLTFSKDDPNGQKMTKADSFILSYLCEIVSENNSDIIRFNFKKKGTFRKMLAGQVIHTLLVSVYPIPNSIYGEVVIREVSVDFNGISFVTCDKSRTIEKSLYLDMVQEIDIDSLDTQEMSIQQDDIEEDLDEITFSGR